MNVVLLELCKELYELSGGPAGWFDTFAKYYLIDGALSIRPSIGVHDDWPGHRLELAAPAYDLGYLLRKLQSAGKTISVEYHSPDQKLAMDLREWAGMYTASTADMPQIKYPYSTEPEAALCSLAINLFKEGALSHE